MRRAMYLSALVLAVGLCGCDSRHMLASVASKSAPYQEFEVDPVGLLSLRAIAVIPFEDRSREGTFDADEFAMRLANQLAGEGVFRVLYPSDILGQTVNDNRDLRRRTDRQLHLARFGIVPEPSEDGSAAAPADDLEPAPASWDPARRREQAVKLARKAGADAVLVGYVTEADPYMRPRVSLTMKLLATGRADAAAAAIAELTQWGVPRAGAGLGGQGLILTRQQNYDAREGNIGRDVSGYGRTHHIDNPYDTEAYLRSMRLYYDVIGRDIAKSLAAEHKAARKESERRAREAARRARLPEAAAGSRLAALIERDERIPDREDAAHGPAYFDQAFPDESLLLARGRERRIRSFRPAGGSDLRRATPAELAYRDNRILAPDGRITGGGGGNNMYGNAGGIDPLAVGGFDAASAGAGSGLFAERHLPNPERVLEAAADRRDKSWRPDVYHVQNPRKALELYDPAQLGGNNYD